MIASLGNTLLAAAFLWSTAAVAAEVDAGFDAFEAAQVMVDKASHSWEWGTAAEALLELFNPELSVFGANPFPGGAIPKANTKIFALNYATSFINIHGQVFVDNSAVGDPASLGVSAILIGQSNSAYLDASNRQADYILNQAPKFSNGAISHRPNVAEIWSDNMAMSFPFLAYLAVQNKDTALMATVVTQCSLQRAVLKASGTLNWRHIIGPESQDTGLWSTGNGWAAYGMTRVLHTLQKWSGSSSMTSQAASLKTWIKEILDGAMASSLDGGLLRNYLNDASWFGEVSGTAVLSAVAYRMAVNDPSMFPQKYIAWADANRATLAKHIGTDGVFSPAVNPLSWLDHTKLNGVSPEGQAFAVYLYTAFRDCVGAGVCPPPATTTAPSLPHNGLGPFDIMTHLVAPVTFSAGAAPTGVICGVPQSCDVGGCNGAFPGKAKFPVCQAGVLKGCQCVATPTTCGPHKSCDMDQCAGSFNGLGNTPFPQCTGNFVGCNCTATSTTCGPHKSCDINGCDGDFHGASIPFPQCQGNFVGCNCTVTSDICGPHQSCDKNGCAGSFNGLGNVAFPQCTGNFVGCECSVNTATTCGPRKSCDLNGCAGSFGGDKTPFPQCTGNFVGCNCNPTDKTCGPPQSCDKNGCAGKFNLDDGKAYCSRNFVGCECTATDTTCGVRQSCDKGNCAGKFPGSAEFAECTNFFKGCKCDATDNTCGPPQSCGLHGCDGAFNLDNGLAFCTNNFVGCKCEATPATCGPSQSCDKGNCAGKFNGQAVWPQCSNFFKGCLCTATSTTCGKQQSCDNGGCRGGFDSKGVARCQGNFLNCPCIASTTTCGLIQSCDKNNCAGAFAGNNVATCQSAFKGCACLPQQSTTCGGISSCTDGGCAGAFNDQGDPVCTGTRSGCLCRPNPIWIPPPPFHPPPPSQTPSLPPLSDTWYCLGVQERDDCAVGFCSHEFSYAVLDMTNGGTDQVAGTGIGLDLPGICGRTIMGGTLTCHGDINTICAAYGIATYKDTTCRTHCPGDPPFCLNLADGEHFASSIGEAIICDRVLS